MAQGISPVKVNRIIASPSPFKEGNTVSISVEIENKATKNYGCVGTDYFKVGLKIYKSTVSPANKLWETSQALTSALGPGEKRTVAFSANRTVPNIDTDKFIFVATGPLCAPDEFGQSTSLTFLRRCRYEELIKMEIIKVPKTDIPK